MDEQQEYFMGHKKLIRKVHNLAHRRHGYYETKKAGTIYYQSSYELRAALLLDDDETVDTFATQIIFYIDAKKRFIDFLVKRTDGSIDLIEVKPFMRLVSFKSQLDDNEEYARKMGWNFKIWTETDLGFQNDYEATKWADEFLSTIKPVDFVEQRKIFSRKKSKKYRDKISADKIEIWCDFCKTTHAVRRVAFDANIARNGSYICEKHGGYIVGSKPKLSLRKENPYAAEGRKQCNECKNIKLFEEFSPDKSKSDGYCTRCKTCRSKAAAKKYHKNTKEMHND